LGEFGKIDTLLMGSNLKVIELNDVSGSLVMLNLGMLASLG
jgi:hypothetical protein